MNDFARQQTRYVRERTSLLSEQFHEDKYPDEKEVQKFKHAEEIDMTDLKKGTTFTNIYDQMDEMAQENLKEKEQPDEKYLKMIGEELKNDESMHMFNAPFPGSSEGIRKRSKVEI
jgi:hypothetical protein